MIQLLHTLWEERQYASRGAVLGVCLAFLQGCGSCGDRQVEGPTPYARCLAREPPASGAVDLGNGLSLRVDGRTLEVEGARLPLDLAAFSGPGSGRAPVAERLQALEASGVKLAILLGDVGDDPETRRELMAGLAARPFATLVLAGGRESAGAIEAAKQDLQGGEKIIDITGLHAIRVGSSTFVPVAGAPVGRYARDEKACGFALQDLKLLAEVHGAPEKARRRWLLAWHAPGDGQSLGVARTDQGLDVGSADLAELARRIGAPGGLFAWPHVQVGRPRAEGGRRALSAGEGAADFRLVVPRIAGPALERGDGSRALPGFALLRLSSEGLALARPPAAP